MLVQLKRLSSKNLGNLVEKKNEKLFFTFHFSVFDFRFSVFSGKPKNSFFRKPLTVRRTRRAACLWQSIVAKVTLSPWIAHPRYCKWLQYYFLSSASPISMSISRPRKLRHPRTAHLLANPLELTGPGFTLRGMGMCSFKDSEAALAMALAA